MQRKPLQKLLAFRFKTKKAVSLQIMCSLERVVCALARIRFSDSLIQMHGKVLDAR